MCGAAYLYTNPNILIYGCDSLLLPPSSSGTGATTLAGLLSALRVKGESPADLHKQKVVIVGAGSAGTGVAQMLMNGECLIYIYIYIYIYILNG